MPPEISDDELKQFTALKEASAKAEADAIKAKADADAAKTKADADAAKAKQTPDPNADPDLRDKIKKEKEARDSRDGEMKGIERALKFTMSVGDFVKDHADILPAEIGEILTAAEKEKYDSAKEKASAVQSAIVQSFFAVQANVDLLTTGQKATLDDYTKLTKNGKEQKAIEIYENLFEPALETLKKVKKAEELGKARSGFAGSSKVEDGYKARLMATSKKTYLGDKGA